MFQLLPYILVLSSTTQDQSSGWQRFNALDTNKDGVLTHSEASDWFALEVDTNKDGQITIIEAKLWAKEWRARQNETDEANKQFILKQEVVYVDEPADAKKQSLDIYGPPKGIIPHPVLVYIHGGAWKKGDKTQGLDKKVPWLAGKGWMFVSINYRLSPAVVHPAHIDDVASAVAWVHEHIDELGGDPERIVVMGHSAGAHLAALVSTDPRKLGVHDKPLSIIKATVLLDGAGYDIPTLLDNPIVMNMSGKMYKSWATEDPEAWKDASPATHVQKAVGIPEFVILHTSRPMAVEQAKQFGELLAENGVNVQVVQSAKDSHMSINQNIGEADHIGTKAIEQVLDRLHSTP